MLDFRIHSFLTLCKHMSYTKAAKELNLTQPAITQHIQCLQEYYHVKLFTYNRNKLTLTPEGTLFRNAMITINRDEEKLYKDLQNVSLGKRLIRFGATPTIGEYLLPARLAAYIKSHPEREISLIVRNTKMLLQMLDKGDLDFLIIEGYFSKEEYSYIPWSVEELICVCAGDHKGLTGTVRFETLFREHLITLPAGSGIQDILIHLLESRNFNLSNFERILEISNLQIVKHLIAADCGIAFLYRKSVEKELAQSLLREVHIADCKTAHEFNFLWRTGSIYEPLFRLFYDKLHD